MTFQPDQYPPELLRALAPVTSVSLPSHQGVTSNVSFAETGLGAVAVKHAAGWWLAALRHERVVLEGLLAHGLPVPQYLFYFEREQGPESEGWLVISRLPGEPLLRLLDSTKDAKVRLPLLYQLGKMVAQIHTLAPPPALTRQPQGWLDAMLAWAESSLADGHWLGSQAQLDELKQERPSPYQPKFIHGDLFLDNVLTDGKAITGIVDWAFSAVGDPRYDLIVATSTNELPGSDQRAFLDGYGMAEDLSAFDRAYYLKLAFFI